MDNDRRLKLGETFWRKVLKPRLFKREAENAHLLTITALKQLQKMGLLPLLRLLYRSPHFDQMPVTVFGRELRNPFFVPAGLDKQGEVLPALDAIGAGAVVVGTAPPRPQSGNAKPRAHRHPETLAVTNNFGFNSIGSQAVAENIATAFTRFDIGCSVGFSVGKNKDTPTDLKALVGDYLSAIRDFLPIMRPRDFIEVNISSPNTSGLRDVFINIDAFCEALVCGIRELAGGFLPPLVLKLPPDGMEGKTLEASIESPIRHGFSGISGVNSTSDWKLKSKWSIWAEGGTSGRPLFELANRVLGEALDIARGRIDFVGIGGITAPEDCLQKKQLGPEVKGFGILTGLYYGGPPLIHKSLEAWRKV